MFRVANRTECALHPCETWIWQQLAAWTWKTVTRKSFSLLWRTKSIQFYWLRQGWRRGRRATKLWSEAVHVWAALYNRQCCWAGRERERESQLIPAMCGPARQLITDSIYMGVGGIFKKEFYWMQNNIRPWVQDESSILLNHFPGNA